jgi:hypothetical protein
MMRISDIKLVFMYSYVSSVVYWLLLLFLLQMCSCLFVYKKKWKKIYFSFLSLVLFLKNTLYVFCFFLFSFRTRCILCKHNRIDLFIVKRERFFFQKKKKKSQRLWTFSFFLLMKLKKRKENFLFSPKIVSRWIWIKWEYFIEK